MQKNDPLNGAPFDRILVGDFETKFCKKTYTLSKMTGEEYVRDPRFHAWGMGWKWYGDAGPTNWVDHADLPWFFSTIDWTRTAFLAQNTAFDASILAWHYGVHPCFLLDTLSMARALRGVGGNSLKKLAEDFALPAKKAGLELTDGLLDGTTLPNEIKAAVIQYCAHDVWLCEEIFKRLLPFPPKELRLIDLTLKMYTRAVLDLDADMLAKAITEEKEKREGLLARLGIEEKALASNPQFALALEALGIEPPLKISKTTGKEAFAFAKNDAHFQALVNGDREEVALLCEARLKVKSTLERTRAQRFLDISKRGKLPVPLDYYKAHTGRWQAQRGAGLNMQNLKRGSFLRNAIMAPEGYVLVVGDLAQIEARILDWIADFADGLAAYKHADPYAVFGTQMFGVQVSKEETPMLRQSAKSAKLGCGFGLGFANFAAQLLVGFQGADPVLYDKKFAKQLGLDRAAMERFLGWEENIKRIEKIPHTCSAEELAIHCLCAKAIIDKYRAKAQPVVALWKHFDALIERSLFNGEEISYKCLVFKRGEIVLPNGMSLKYPDLRKTKEGWVYGEKKKLYGGKITENVCQALARIVIGDGLLRVAKKHQCVGTVHDEIICVVDEREADEAVPWVNEQMVKVPAWMPGIPLKAGVGYAKRYGEVDK
jgi:hypothetical protein